MEKQETIFRQKSVDRVSSPEQLDNYLKVTSPSVWLVLIGIIIILVGAICWSAFGKLKSYTTCGCMVENGAAYCYVKEDDNTKIDSGMTIEITKEEKQIEIISVNNTGLNIPDTYSYLQHLVNVTSQDYVVGLTGYTDLADGYYSGRIATELVSPISFILN